jgi:hypothetical protein
MGFDRFVRNFKRPMEMVERGYYFSMLSRIGLCVVTCKCDDFFFEDNGICFF